MRSTAQTCGGNNSTTARREHRYVYPDTCPTRIACSCMRPCQTLEQRISQIRTTLTTLALTRTGAQSELTDLVRTRTELECTIADLRLAADRAGGRREELQAELDTTKTAIAAREADLGTLLPEWEAQRTLETEEKRRLDDARARLDALFAKRGRLNRFRTRAERDQFLRGEIASIDAYHASQTAALESLRSTLQETRQALEDIRVRSDNDANRIEDGRQRAKEIAEQLAALKEQHVELTEKRKSLWREETKLDSLVTHAADELRTAERNLASMMDKVSDAFCIEGRLSRWGRILGAVCVPLTESLNGTTWTACMVPCTDSSRSQMRSTTSQLNSPLVTGKRRPSLPNSLTPHCWNSLFHVVTDTDDTAKRLLDIMNREKTGRLTFMPLNRLRPGVPSYPDAQDAIPLIQKLRFNDRDVKAFQQVFGKTCVCRDLTIAAAYVKSHGINTITLDGDKVDRKGALTGGYHDVRRSRIEAIKAVTSWKSKHSADDKRLQEVKRTIVTTEQEITRITGKIQVLSNQQMQARQARDTVAEEMTSLSRERERLTERVAKLEGDIVDLETEISNLDARSESLRTELASPLARGLTGEEEQLIEAFGREIEQRQKQLLELGKKKNEVRASCVDYLDDTDRMFSFAARQSQERSRD